MPPDVRERKRGRAGARPRPGGGAGAGLGGAGAAAKAGPGPCRRVGRDAVRADLPRAGGAAVGFASLSLAGRAAFVLLVGCRARRGAEEGGQRGGSPAAERARGGLKARFGDEDLGGGAAVQAQRGEH
jgi:hypothetical protein